jgi:hypothetical protein
MSYHRKDAPRPQADTPIGHGTVAAAAARSGDNCRPAPRGFLDASTIPEVITHSAHPAEPEVRRIGPETPFGGQSPG